MSHHSFTLSPPHFSRFLLLLPVLILILLITGISVQAQQSPPPLTLDGRAPGDGFGSGVALDGDSALIGAADGLHVFVRSGTTWSHQAKLEASDGIPLKVGAINGDTAVGYNDTINTPGAVVIFVRSGTTWTQQAKLTIDQNDFPQTEVSGPVVLAGDRLLFGATDYSINGDKPRLRVFAYNRTGSTWTLEVEFAPGGYSTARDITIDGNSMVIFNELYTEGYEPGGYVSVYDHSGVNWAYLIDADVIDGDPDVPGTQGNFSVGVDKSGSTIASGGYIFNYDNEDGTLNSLYDVVFIHILSGSTLTRQALLKPTNNLGHHYYNLQVDLDGNTLLVTVRDPDTNVVSVLYYARSGSTWTLQSSPVTDYTDNIYLGRPTSLSGNTVLIGAQSESAAYVYVLNGTTWSLQAKLALAPDAAELLVNGGFELGSGYDPTGWKLSTYTGAVKRDCFDPAYEGFCSLSFEYGTYKAVQNVDLNTHNLNTGDKIKLTGFYTKWGKNTYIADVWLYVSYANLPDDQGHISLKKATSGWAALPKIAITLKAKPTRVRVVLQATADYQGETRLDNLSLQLITPAFKLAKQQAKQAGQPELLPLP